MRRLNHHAFCRSPKDAPARRIVKPVNGKFGPRRRRGGPVGRQDAQHAFAGMGLHTKRPRGGGGLAVVKVKHCRLDKDAQFLVEHLPHLIVEDPS
jgi:hypothetical protein